MSRQPNQLYKYFLPINPCLLCTTKAEGNKGWVARTPLQQFYTTAKKKYRPDNIIHLIGLSLSLIF